MDRLVNNLDSYLHCLPSMTKCSHWRLPQQMVLMASKTKACPLSESTSQTRWPETMLRSRLLWSNAVKPSRSMAFGPKVSIVSVGQQARLRTLSRNWRKVRPFIQILAGLVIIFWSYFCGNIDLEAVDLDAPEWSGDINNVASVLKMWLRELPDPLLTDSLHQGFIEAASA